MANWTFKKMMSSLRHQAGQLDLTVDVGTEDGFTWITIDGTSAIPKNFELISQMVADATGRDFYAQSASVGSLCGALDVDPAKQEDAEPFHYLKRHIEDYGTKFEPSEAECKYRRSSLSAEEQQLADVFSGSCDPSAQERVEALLAKTPSLMAARLESLVWEVQNPRGGPMQRTAPLWWSALAGSDPEGWSAWMSVSDSEISAEALIKKAEEMTEAGADSARRIKALAEFGIKPRRRAYA